jgi:hypothetical protein
MREFPMSRTIRHSITTRFLLQNVCRVLVALLALLEVPQANSQAGSSPPSRPILFVHGYCGTTDSWSALRTNLASRLNGASPTLYPLVDPSNNPDPSLDGSNYYDVYYDGTTVHFLLNGSLVGEQTIPPSARFFSMHFFDPASGTWNNPTAVSQVSILNKADELAHVLREINRVTQISDVIVIAHSMGGLVSRAYLENMASPLSLSCYAYKINGEGVPAYSNGLCDPGGNKYQGEIAQLITLDTPHGGFDQGTVVGFLNDLWPACVSNSSTTESEMVPGSELLENLNYYSTSIAAASPVPSQVTIHSIQSWYSSEAPPFDPIILTRPISITTRHS